MTLTLESAEPVTVALAEITIDPDLQCRATGTQKEVVEEYADLYRAGVALPPVVVFADPKGVHWLADGWHRCAAAEAAGLAEVPAEVRPGGRRDALLFAAGANAAHGLRRSNADKRRAVGLVLAACPKWSNRRVGEACGVDDKTVAAVKRTREEASAEIPHPPEEGVLPPINTDKVVSQLSKRLTAVLEAWPQERRAELRDRLLAIVTAPEAES